MPMRLLVLLLSTVSCEVSIAKKKPKLQQVHAFTLGNTLNGGLVGALGPSISTFQASTGLTHGELARTIMLNRLAKLFGTFVWAYYADRLQRGETGLRLAGCTTWQRQGTNATCRVITPPSPPSLQPPTNSLPTTLQAPTFGL